MFGFRVCVCASPGTRIEPCHEIRALLLDRGLAPKTEAGRLWVHQLQLTVADFVLEIHDTHHPLGPSLY